MDTRHLPLFNRKLLDLNLNGFPTNCLLEITHRCQAACRYCYHPDKHTTTTELATEELGTVIRKLDADGICYLTLTGGDPFIRSDCITVLETAFSQNFFGVTIFSSGYGINENHLSFLGSVRKQIPFLQMTVFSHKQELHDRYVQVPGGLQRIMSTGRKLLANGIAVQIVLPVMEFNLSTITTTIEYLENEGFKVTPSITKLITPENTTPELLYETSRDFYSRLLNTMPPERLQHLYSRYDKQKDSTAKDHRLCHGLLQTVMIDHRGMLRPCASFRNVELCSYMNDTPLHTLLAKNATYQRLISLTKNDLKCGTCRNQQFCMPCIGRWHSFSGECMQPDHQSCNLAESFRTHRESTLCATEK